MYFVFSVDVNRDFSGSNTTNIIAGVMVIGSLIVGLLFALLCFRKRKFHREYTFYINSKGNKLTTYIYSYFISHTHFSDYVCRRDI